MNDFLPETLYLVQALAWEYVEGETLPRYRCPDAELGEPVSSPLPHDLALDYCLELEREKRAEVNPFEYCEQLEDLTALDVDRWHDWLLDAGLELPVGSMSLTRNHWHRWWEERTPLMTEWQLAKVWQALDKLRFFQVVELSATTGW